jgi:glyoxylase-like metal-dependent hydrolase (beta-lactamase superfamily II)
LVSGLQVARIVTGRWRQNCYVVSDKQGRGIIVDPGSQAEDIAAHVDENGLRVEAILNTHGHFDHIGAVASLQDRYDAPFYLHGADGSLLKRANLYRMLFEARDPVRVPGRFEDIAVLPSPFSVGSFVISWIATPGHTDGSVCFLIEDLLFSGDTLMRNAVGRTDLPGGDRSRLAASIRRLMTLPSGTTIYPGHGDATSVAAECAADSAAMQLLR